MSNKGSQAGSNEGSLAKLMHGHFNLPMLSSNPPSDGSSPENQSSTGGSPQPNSSDAGGSAFARFGKALYGRNLGPTPVPTSAPTSAPSHVEPPSNQPPRLSFTTKSGILAMSPSPDWSQAVIAGRDFLQIVNVTDTEIVQHLDLFGSPGYKEKHPLSSVSVVKWGLRQYAKYIILGKTNGHIQVYNADSTTSKASYQLHEYNTSINSLGLNPHATHMLLSGNSAGIAKTWDMRSSNKKPLAQFVKNGDICRELKVSPFDSTKFAMIYDSGVVQRWDIRNPSAPERRMNAHAQRGLTLDWHEEFDYIVTGGRDKQIQIWNMSAGETARVPDHVINTPNGVHKVRWQQHAFNPKSILDCDIASSSMDLYDYRVHIWSPRRKYIPRIVIEDHEARLTEVQWKSGTQLWTAARDNKFIQRDISYEEPVINQLPKVSNTWSTTGLLMTVQGNNVINQHEYEDNAPSTVPGSSAASVHEREREGSRVSLRLSFNSRTQQKPKMHTLKEDRPVDQLLYEVPHVGINEKSIALAANNAAYQVSETFTVLDICIHNARVAKAIGRPRMAQTWLVLHRSLEWELEEWKKRREEKREKFEKLSSLVLPTRQNTMDRGSGPNSATGNLLSSLKSLEGTPRPAPAPVISDAASITSRLSLEKTVTQDSDTRPTLLTSRSISSPVAVPTTPKSGSRSSSQRRSSFGPATAESAGSAGSDIAFGSYESGSNSEEAISPVAQENFTHLGISRTVGPKDGTFSGPSTPSSATTSGSVSILNGKGINPEARSLLTGIIEEGSFSSNSSVRSLMVEDREKVNPGREKDASLASSVSNLASSHHSFSQSHTDDSEDFFGGGVALHRSQSPESEDDDMLPANKSSIAATASALAAAAVPSAAMRSTPSVITKGIASPKKSIEEVYTPPENPDYISDSELDEFVAFSQSLQHPWSPLKLLKDSNEYYHSDGDVQFCAIIALIFSRTHPSAFPEDNMVEEVLHCYITQLQKLQCVVALAELINSCTKFKSIYHMGQTNTSINQQCPTCGSVLSEANAASEQKAYWYCSKCHNLLDGCVLCRETVKGLGACMLACGHYGHFECMKSWVIDDNMTECPSGCGVKITEF